MNFETRRRINERLTDDALYGMEYARLHELYTELTGETADDTISSSDLLFTLRGLLNR